MMKPAASLSVLRTFKDLEGGGGLGVFGHAQEGVESRRREVDEVLAARGSDVYFAVRPFKVGTL